MIEQEYLASKLNQRFTQNKKGKHFCPIAVLGYVVKQKSIKNLKIPKKFDFNLLCYESRAQIITWLQTRAFLKITPRELLAYIKM